MKKIKVTLIILGFLVMANVAICQEKSEKGKYGIGFQSSFPAWGISGIMDVTDNVSVQGIFGAFGDLKTYAGRGIYRFVQKPSYNTYGYGMIGNWSYTGYKIGESWNLEETTEKVMGFGAGVGVEYNWKAIPPVWWNAEIGFGSVKFKEVDYDFSSLMVGVGAHYRF